MSFQPFAVQCLTCGSRLRVTDPSIVGTIATCPKCHSMVQIERPGAQIAVGRPNVDSEAITEDAIAAGDAENFEESTDPGFAGGESVQETTTPSAVPPEWQSEKTRRSRQVAMIVALSISGLLTAAVVFGSFVRSWSKPTEVAQAAPEQTTTAEPEDDSDSDSDPEVETTATPPIQEDESDSTPQASEQPVEATPTTEPGDDDNQQPETPDAGIHAQETPAPDAADVTTDSVVPNDLMPRSPLDPLPGEAAPQAAQQDDAGTGMQDLGGLEQFIPFLNDSGAIEAPALKPPTAMEVVKIEAAAEDDAVGPAKVRKLNLKADLARQFAVQTEGYPPAEAVLLIGQLTGVPIQVDWVSFDLAGIDIDAPVKMQQKWQSARSHLETVAAAVGAEIREEETLLIFTLTDDRFDETLAGITDLENFGNSRESAVTVLNQFLNNGPAAGKELTLGEVRQEQQLACLAIEALRRMRNVDAKVDDVRLQRWARAADAGVEWSPVTGGVVGAQPDAPIALAEFLNRTAKSNRATAVVNWYDANRRGITPHKLVFPYNQADAGQTLSQVLTPLGLQVRRVDNDHWWVGTEATYDRLTAVVWTGPLGASRELFTRRIKSIMQGASRDIFRMAIDDESDRALLLLPRYIVRQLPKIAPSIAANESR